MTHHNTHGTLDGVEGKYDRVYVFSEALDDRIVFSFCYIPGIGITEGSSSWVKKSDIPCHVYESFSGNKY